MLVLSRRLGETIRIGDDVIVTFTKVKGNRVVIGIDAPPEISIRRGELTDNSPPGTPPESEIIPLVSHQANPVIGSVDRLQPRELLG